MSTFIGIDPGEKGGLARIRRSEDFAETWATKMPATAMDTWLLIADWEEANVFAMIEKATGMIPGRRGVKGIGKLQFNRGLLVMALTASKIPFEEVSPAKWQRYFGLIRKKGETDKQKKNRHKERAQRLFPALKVTHAIADSLLIAEYCRRMRTSNCGSSAPGANK